MTDTTELTSRQIRNTAIRMMAEVLAVASWGKHPAMHKMQEVLKLLDVADERDLAEIAEGTIELHARQLRGIRINERSTRTFGSANDAVPDENLP